MTAAGPEGPGVDGPGSTPLTRDVTATVTGTGHAEVEPDRVRMHVRVQVAESSAKAATDSFAVELAAARALFDELGCTYLVGSVTSWQGEERRARYQVWSDVVVRVEDLGVLPRLVERVLKAEKLGVNRFAWEASGIRELRRAARVKAIEDAKEAAGDYAAALGLRVSQVLSVNDPDTGGMRPSGVALSFARSRSAAADRPEIDLSNTEPVRVEGQVTMTFLLAE